MHSETTDDVGGGDSAVETGLELWTHDGILLYGRLWRTPVTPRAVLCLVHGLGEHGGRYAHVADFLGRRGYALMAFDLRGHGGSGGARGHVPGIETIMDDIDRMLAAAAGRFPGLPALLYGHSTGGNLVLNHALRRRPRLSGVIATAPLLRASFEPPLWKRALAGIMRRILPSMPLSSGLRTEDISRDTDVVRSYGNDPLVHDRVTVRFLDVRRAGFWALDHADGFTLPLLLMHGDADLITSHEASIEFAAGVGNQCTLRIWKGLYHEIHNEPEKDAVLGFLAEWLDGILKNAES